MNSSQLNRFPMGPCELTKPVRLTRNCASASDTFDVAPGLDSSWGIWLVGWGSHRINHGKSVDLVSAIVISARKCFRCESDWGEMSDVKDDESATV